MVALAKAMNYYHPNFEAWPNVVMPGFFDTAPQIRAMLQLDNVAFVPIVEPSKLPDFETFMYEYFGSEPAIPNNTGTHNFGRGVYATDPSNPNRTYHDTTGKTLLFDSPNEILTPVLQLLTSRGTNDSQYTFNIHSNVRTGTAIDRILACSATQTNYTVASKSCGWFANSLPLPDVPTNPDFPPEDFASAALMPIYLGQNTSQLVGFIGTAISWHSVLLQTFTGLGGYELVISSENVTFTYYLSFGAATLKGLGDLHDRKFDSYGRATELTVTGACLTNESPDVVYLYPTDAFFERYRTSRGNYIGAAVGLIVGLLGTIFILYDFLVRRETHRKAKMLDSKRKFVRFISHEIRTPLNSVHLGLELLVEELKNMAHTFASFSSSPFLAATSSAELFQSVRESLANWLELAADLMGNSESAVDVLNDLLNYDKIEMGTLRLDFAAVAVAPGGEVCSGVLPAGPAARHPAPPAGCLLGFPLERFQQIGEMAGCGGHASAGGDRGQQPHCADYAQPPLQRAQVHPGGWHHHRAK